MACSNRPRRAAMCQVEGATRRSNQVKKRSGTGRSSQVADAGKMHRSTFTTLQLRPHHPAANNFRSPGLRLSRWGRKKPYVESQKKIAAVFVLEESSLRGESRPVLNQGTGCNDSACRSSDISSVAPPESGQRRIVSVILAVAEFY